MLEPKCDQQSWEVTTLTAHHHPPHHWQVLSPRARVEGTRLSRAIRTVVCPCPSSTQDFLGGPFGLRTFLEPQK